MNLYMYKEVAFKEGIELYDSGESVYILKPTQNGRFALYSLEELFSGCRFLYDIEVDEKDMISAKNGSSKKIRVDVSKIQALKKAGWSQKQVAKELSCSLSTVSRYWCTDNKYLKTERA